MADADVTGAYAGDLAKTYVNTGTYALPTWSEIKRIEDVDAPNSRGGSEMKTRDSDYAKFIPGKRSMSLAFTYTRKRGTDAVYDKLKASYDDKTVVLDIAQMNKAIAISGATGWRAPMIVTKFDEKYPLEDRTTVDVELKIVDVEHPTAAGTTWEPAALTTA